MAPSTYFVKDGHTLGFIQEARPGWFNVLHGSVLLGGHDWRNGPVPLTSLDTLIPATAEDFDTFGVCSKGHIQ